MDYHPKNILATGTAGFIGSHFVHHTLAKHKEVQIISLDKLTYAGNKANLDGVDEERHHFIEGDINDSSLIAKIIRQFHIDTIVHFAAESHVDNSIANPKIFLETNILGTFTLLEAARQYWLAEKNWNHNQCRFHHISTDEVFGTLQLEDAAFTEEHPYKPNSPYSASKAGSDHIVRAYFYTYQLPITISNCSNNFGPKQHNEKLIPTVIRSCANQKPIPVYGNGKNIRDWLYVVDHIDAILAIINRGVLGETYNIGGNCELDNLTLIRQICNLMDELRPENAPHENLISFVTDRKGHDFRYAINNNKIKNELGCMVQTDFKQALRETINSYLKQVAFA